MEINLPFVVISIIPAHSHVYGFNRSVAFAVLYCTICITHGKLSRQRNINHFPRSFSKGDIYGKEIISFLGSGGYWPWLTTIKVFGIAGYIIKYKLELCIKLEIPDHQ
jgi:hypothetical protein